MELLRPPSPKLPLVSEMVTNAKRAYKFTLGADKAAREKALKDIEVIKMQAQEKLAWYEGRNTDELKPKAAATLTKNKKLLAALLEELNEKVK